MPINKKGKGGNNASTIHFIFFTNCPKSGFQSKIVEMIHTSPMIEVNKGFFKNMVLVITKGYMPRFVVESPWLWQLVMKKCD